jgi:hypothetical protein
LDALEANSGVDTIQNLIYQKGDEIIKTPQALLQDQDKLPQLPYEYLNKHYRLERYLARPFLERERLLITPAWAALSLVHFVQSFRFIMQDGKENRPILFIKTSSI